MSIIEPEQIVLTREQRLQEYVNGIKSRNAFLYDTVERHITDLFGAVWSHEEFTPQEIIDGFGNSATTLFYITKLLQDSLKATNPQYEVLVPPKDFTANQDGSVTVLPVPEPEPIIEE